ncbi:MAG: DUF3037 domain-containing protein [Planctomycetota bacterium]
METKSGYYSLIQYCPDFSREEVVNVGILLLCPEIHFLEVCFSKSNERAKKLFGKENFDSFLIRSAKETIETRIKLQKEEFCHVEGLSKFIQTRANDLKITPLRSIKIADPERELKELFKELVEEKPVKLSKKSLLLPELDTVLHSQEFKGKIQFNRKIEHPFSGEKIEFPYCYQNGSLNLIKPEEFSEGKRGIAKVEQLACEGDILQREPEPDQVKRKLIVIPLLKNPKENSKLQKIVHRVFEYYKIETVSQENIPKFIERVKREIEH